MSKNPNVRPDDFEEPQPLTRSSARVQDERGNLIGITLIGPQDAVRRYIAQAALRIEVMPPEEIKIPEAPPAADQKPSNVPIHEGRLLDIHIRVARTPLPRYVLHIEADPDIPPGYSHAYYVSAKQAQATSLLGPHGFNDPDLELYEWINERYRLRARGSEIVEDGILKDKLGPTNRLADGDWRLRVYDANGQGCSYELEGMFLGHGPILE